MRDFQELLRKVTSSRHFDRLIQFTRPLKDHLGINHFWYYRVTNTGHYTYVGTHVEWSEYCFENFLLKRFPILRHPNTQKAGISLMKNTQDEVYLSVQKEASERFGVNFNINISTKSALGIEAIGFASEINHPIMDEKILNELPLLCHFAKVFKKEYQNILDLALDQQVNIAEFFGPDFYGKDLSKGNSKEKLLKDLGLLPVNPLTIREKEILKHTANGYPASLIAKRLHLSTRTVENRLADIKCKLFCNSKSELIDQARDLEAIGYLI